MARSTQQQLRTRQMQKKALELRLQGDTYEEIAAAVGYAGASGAQKAVRRALTEVGAEEARELYFFQYERLNTMLYHVWPIVDDPTHPKHHQAISSALKIMDQMNKLAGLT